MRALYSLFITCLIALVACDATGPQSQPTGTYLSFASEPGDWVGQGESHRYVLTDGTWAVSYDTVWGAGRVAASFSAPGTYWEIVLSGAASESPPTGEWVAARRWPFNNPAAGLDFSGQSRGCNEITGRFIIFDLKRRGDTVDYLHAAWEQHCEGGDPVLKGEIAILANPWR
jgi:hypothetical protein